MATMRTIRGISAAASGGCSLAGEVRGPRLRHHPRLQRRAAHRRGAALGAEPDVRRLGDRRLRRLLDGSNGRACAQLRRASNACPQRDQLRSGGGSEPGDRALERGAARVPRRRRLLAAGPSRADGGALRLRRRRGNRRLQRVAAAGEPAASRDVHGPRPLPAGRHAAPDPAGQPVRQRPHAAARRGRGRRILPRAGARPGLRPLDQDRRGRIHSRRNARGSRRTPHPPAVVVQQRGGHGALQSTDVPPGAGTRQSVASRAARRPPGAPPRAPHRAERLG